MGAGLRKLMKLLASWVPGNGIRIGLLRACGYRIGSGVYIGPGFLVADELRDTGGEVVIGHRVAIGPRVTLVTASSPNESRLRHIVGMQKGRIVIEDDAWIGAGAIILPGVTVGAMSIVGAGAVVTESIPSRTMAVGVPAKVVRKIEEPHET